MYLPHTSILILVSLFFMLSNSIHLREVLSSSNLFHKKRQIAKLSLC